MITKKFTLPVIFIYKNNIISKSTGLLGHCIFIWNIRVSSPGAPKYTNFLGNSIYFSLEGLEIRYAYPVHS